jgi:hypothetical protein
VNLFDKADGSFTLDRKSTMANLIGVQALFITAQSVYSGKITPTNHN